MSQRDIASELYVSLNTVKTHCRAIYRKLGVGDRRAAVQAARDLHLPSAPFLGEPGLPHRRPRWCAPSITVTAVSVLALKPLAAPSCSSGGYGVERGLKIRLSSRS